MANYYCDPSVVSDGVGTIGDPFKALATLQAAMGDGDTGFLKRGERWAQETLDLPDSTSEANRKTIDAYDSGALPYIDYEWANPGNYAGVVDLGSFCTFQNVKVGRAGPQNSGTDSGGRCIMSKNKTAPRVLNCEVDGAWRSGVIYEDCVGSATLIDTVDATDTQRSEQSGFNWPFSLQIHDCDDATISNCTVHEVFGEGIGSNVGATNCTINNNEVFAAKKQGIFANDGSDGVLCERNIVYGTTNSLYHRSGPTVGQGLSSNVETFQNTADAEAYGGTELYLNLVAFTKEGIWFADEHPSAESHDMQIHQNTLVDNLFNFWVSADNWTTGNSAQGNISMPISSTPTMDHVRDFDGPSGIWDYTYWYTGTKAAPTGNVTGSNDRSNTTPVITNMGGFTSNATLGGITAPEFKPTTSVVGVDNSLGKDYFQDSITHDEFGAIIFEAAGAAGEVNLDVTSVTFNEDDGTVNIGVTRSGGTAGAASVDLVDLGTGTAVAGTDYTAFSPATFNWADGVGGQDTISITLTDRAGEQGPRTINCQLQNASVVSIGGNLNLTITIEDAGVPSGGVGGGLGDPVITGQFRIRFVN